MNLMSRVEESHAAADGEQREILRPVASAWPKHERDEVLAVVRILESGRVNALVHGEQNKAFEREFAEFVRMPFAIAVSNGTVSIELALRALGVGLGDEVIIPVRSFFATASAVVAIGAEPVFADVETETQNIDPASVARMISDRTKAVICVHLAGRPCDMTALTEICEAHDLLLIEDCAQAHGALYKGQQVGSFGHASSFSFCTDKIMSTGGEGGMVLFRNEDAWAKAWAGKDHGKLPAKFQPENSAAPGEFRYLHSIFGSNYRMTEMQAAIGRAQLKKLPKWLQQRRANAETLALEIDGLPGIIFDKPPAYESPAWYKFYIRVDEGMLPNGLTRSDIIGGLMQLGIQCGSGSCPDMSREDAFANRPPRKDEIRFAHKLAASTIMFPVDHLLDEDDMLAIAAGLRKVLGQ